MVPADLEWSHGSVDKTAPRTYPLELAETVGAAVGLSRPIGTAAIIHIEKNE